MSCGKKRLVKSWDRPRHLRVVKPSRYEQNEPSVRQHWRKVIKELEMAHKDEKFWETSMETVKELVGPVVFRRLARIFDLPGEPLDTDYSPKAEGAHTVPSVTFYKNDELKSNLATKANIPVRKTLSTSDIDVDLLSMLSTDQSKAEQSSSGWSTESSFSSDDPLRRISRIYRPANSKSLISRSKSGKVSARSASVWNRRSTRALQMSSPDESTHTEDDLQVHPGGFKISRIKRRANIRNPHFELLYCTESEADMVKWDSKLYERNKFFVSESDEFSKKAEILSKQIAKDFYEWWVAFGTDEYKSDIKRPEDIEELFQVWFDEHASRGLVLISKIIPCVLKSIAQYVGVPKKSCSTVLRRQVAWDIRKETRPQHTRAFGRSLPNKMKHIPPKNNTSKLWHGVIIPEDLRTMSCVWEDILNLTSTKAFHEWLTLRPHLPMPPCLKELNSPDDNQMLYLVPSDFVQRDRSTSSIKDLNFPVSQYAMEMKEVLDKLMD